MLFRSFSNVCFYILVGSFPCRHLTVHAHQEFIVVFGFFQTVFYEVHCLYRVHIGKILAENPHAIQRLLVLQQVIATSAGSNDIDSREDALVGQVAVELQFHITSTFELFKDHFVHFGTGIYKRRSKDGQRTTAFNVAGSTEEAFRLVQCVASTPPDNTYPKPGKQYCRHVPNVLWSQGR